MNLRLSCILAFLSLTLSGYADSLSQTISKHVSQNNGPQIAVIIDDMGYQLQNGLRAIALPGALTLSILPHSPNGWVLARIGHKIGKEIMLHAPMSNIRGLPLDQGGLTEEMNHTDFINTLNNNLNAIPHISGVNNHMGSSLTQKPQPMQWLMTTLKQRGLYFIDSRTSAESLAWETALTHQLPSLKRDVFLDNDRDPEKISTQFLLLLRLAKKNGYALAIGHPYTETLNVLEKNLKLLQENGIKLVSVSQLLQQTAALRTQGYPAQSY